MENDSEEPTETTEEDAEDLAELVDEFYKAALAAGGKDNGAPGIREVYHPHYYG